MSKKILVVESDVPLAGSIAGALQARGVEVALVRDAPSAVDAARAERPDAIVLCAELTGGSGFLVCNKLRKDPELREIPLLVTSAEASDETFEQHRRLKTRADAYLRKPFSVPDLLSQLGGLAELPAATTTAVADEQDLAAFDAAFDSIAQLSEVPAPVEQPISAEDAEAAAALLADVPQVEEARAVRSSPLPPAAPRAVDPELERLRAAMDAVRQELEASRSELERTRASCAALQQHLAAERERTRALEASAEAASASREQVRQALAGALALLERREG